jgi:hypothetical protein
MLVGINVGEVDAAVLEEVNLRSGFGLDFGCELGAGA